MTTPGRITVTPVGTADNVFVVQIDGLAAGLVYGHIREMTGSLAAMFSPDTLTHLPMDAENIRRRLQSELDDDKAKRPIDAIAEESHGVRVIEVSVPGVWEQWLELTPYSLHMLRKALEEAER